MYDPSFIFHTHQLPQHRENENINPFSQKQKEDTGTFAHVRLWMDGLKHAHESIPVIPVAFSSLDLIFSASGGDGVVSMMTLDALFLPCGLESRDGW